MNIITKYPVLVNPVRSDINNYSLNESSEELPGQIQKVAVGDFVIKGTNPVFDNDTEITINDFMFLDQIKRDSETLTPMDEYENITGEELLGNPYSKPLGNPYSKPIGKPSGFITKITPAQFTETVKDIPGGPTAAEQIVKAKNEGKFWNGLKGAYEKFKVTENGQIIVNSSMALLLSKLGGAGTTSTTTDTAPTADGNSNEKLNSKQPMSKTTKTILIVAGVAVIGLIIYSVVKKK